MAVLDLIGSSEKFQDVLDEVRGVARQSALFYFTAKQGQARK